MQQDTPPHINQLINRFLNGDATDAELDELEQWYQHSVDSVIELSLEEHQDQIHARLKSRILTAIKEDLITENPEKDTSFRRRIPTWAKVAAAVLLLALGYIGYQYADQFYVSDTNIASVVADIEDRPSPTKNAYLLEQDSAVLDLSHVDRTNTTGLIQTDSDGTIQIAETTTRKQIKAPARQLQVIVPKGNLFDLILPDGTKVWLNADSKLSFPSYFDGNERHVYLTGEGYFEVESDEKHPFIVHTKHQEIKVTGTRFNVFSYDNELTESTSLFEGKVSLRHRETNETVLLQPGQSGLVQPNTFQVMDNVSEEHAVAWTSAVFVFEGETFEHILRKISRWYDMDVDWNGIPTSKQVYTGKIRKEAGMKEVLTMLGVVSGVSLQTKNNTLKIQ